MKLKLVSEYSSALSKHVNIYAPLIALLLLSQGCGMDHVLMYKFVILPTIRLRFLKFIEAPKLPCREG